jgi:hypothetical protein
VSAGGERAIGVWGAFDTDALGPQIRMRVVVSELARRRPDLVVRAFAPSGAQRPFAADAGEPLEALDERFGARMRELADALDVVVFSVDVGDLADDQMKLLAGPGSPARLAWHAVGIPDPVSAERAAAVAKAATHADRISLLDDGSAKRWTASGGKEGFPATAHPALLVPRLFASELLAARLEFLRAIEAWPPDARVIVVQADAETVPDALVRALTDRPVVAMVADGRAGDAQFAGALVARLPSARQLPPDAGTEDRVAAIAGAAGVVATSPVVRDIARAFGVPNASIDAFSSRPDAATLEQILVAPRLITDDERRIDDDLDAIAALAPVPAPGALAWSELAAARAALAARGRRLTAERVAMADAVLADRERVAALERRVAELEAAYQDVRNLEVVRWRVALGDLRTRLHLRRKR